MRIRLSPAGATLSSGGELPTSILARRSTSSRIRQCQIGRSIVISAVYRCGYPRIANAHVREFIRQGVDLNAQASDEAARFLEKELGEIKQRLEQSELALNNYRRDM